MRLLAPAAALLLLWGGVLTLGCRGTGPAAERRAPLSRETKGAFEGMRRALETTRVPREREDAPRLRSMNRLLANAGLQLLRAPPPHDLKRAHGERFLEGRSVFGDALRRWVTVVVSGTDEEVLEAYDTLVDAFWGWHDAARGRVPERCV